MSEDITLKPKMQSGNTEFDEYIEDIEINFKTNKDSFIGTFNSWNILLNLNSNNIEIPDNIKPLLIINKKNFKMPTFLLTPVSDEETTEDVKVKGYDKSILFDTPFEWTQTLPCTVGQLTQNICNKIGVKLKDTNFANSDFMIYNQVADNKRTNREVIAMIAAIAGGNAFINSDDELEIRSFIDSELTVEEYFTSEKFTKIGPITGINLAREPIKDYKELNDASLSAKYKSCMIKITNNLIVDDNRELALQPIYNKLHGLEFYCKKIQTHEAYSVKPFSFIQCNDNKVLVDTICIKYPTLIDSYISSNQLTEVESTVNDKNKNLKQRIINAEAKVDEVEGKINLITTEVTEHEDKLSEIKLDIDSITHKVENVVDLTREVSGATRIQLDNCMKGELLELHIYGNNTVFERVFPSKKLYPGKNLYPRGYGKIAINKINIKDRFEAIYSTRNFTGYCTKDNTIDNSDYYVLVEDGTYNYMYYIMPLEEGKTYDILLDKEQVNSNSFIRIVTFENNPFETNESIKSVNYYGTRRRRYNDGKYEWYTNTQETEFKFTASAEEKYLVLYTSPLILFETLRIYENYQEIELTELKRGLRQHEDTCDELILKNNKLQVIRRIGVDSEGNKYKLENEIIEDLENLKIELPQGTNYIEILNYVANMKAKYIVLNEITSKFASVAVLKTTIAQLADSINLTLSKKINEEEIIAAINMAVIKASGGEISKEEVEKTLIQIFANLLEIRTDNFQLDRDGTTTIIKGIIAGLTMVREGTISRLYKKIGDYESGLWIPDLDPTVPFLFAGYDKSKGSSIFNSNAYITHSGKIFAKWFEVNGESGYFYVRYDNGKIAMELTKDYIHRFLSNGNRWTSEGIGLMNGGPTAHTLWLYDALFYSIESAIHNEWYFRIYRRGNNNEAPSADFNCNVYINRISSRKFCF